MIKKFEDLSKAIIRHLSCYYTMYSTDGLAESFAWEADRILNSCEDSLRNKVREILLGISLLESGGPLMIKIMLNIVMDVDNITLCVLIENL